jgi:hypothetical protein
MHILPLKPLCCLLILLLGLFGEFDSEERLDAGAEIEGFAGPAGPDDLGVGVLEAVDRGQPVPVGLLSSAERVVEMLARFSSLTQGKQGCPSGLVNSQPSDCWVMVTPPSCTAV